MKYFVVDAFTDELFKGNPAGVCLLDKWADDSLLQSIAFENNLAETAFVVKNDSGYDLRWFTPETEIDLCGHATLASAFIITNFVDKNTHFTSFSTKSGILTVNFVKENELYEMDFPARKPVKTEINQIVQKAVNVQITEAYKSRDLLLLVDTEEQVKNLEINFDILKTYKDCFAFIITAPSSGSEYDFVSRFFAPNAGIMEDPVTGSSHSTLIPFWAERLNKNKLTAKQLSKRGGILYCENNEDRVKISGKAKLYLEGNIKIQY
ncbi:MAG: PhzF family phenazine biosynthesis protein [Treponema sp.]|nr:PhzF family phenazine biosynthesis protein [Treponema sp.]